MTPQEQGRFCSNCSSAVTDFSAFTDKELLEYLSKNKGSGCGRFNDTQLNRLLIVNEPSSTPVYRRALFGAALVAGVAGTAQGQNIITTTASNKQTVTSSDTKASASKLNASDSTFRLSGTVIDSATKNPLPFVSVSIEINGKHIADNITDVDGMFLVTIPNYKMGTKVTIATNYSGYYSHQEDFILTQPLVYSITIPIASSWNRNDSVVRIINYTAGKMVMNVDTTKKKK